MKYNSKLDDLFEDWIAASVKNNEWQSTGRVIFTKDGLLEKNDPTINIESLWENSKKRILFLIKDQPTKWSDDIRLWLRNIADDNKYAQTRKCRNRDLKSRFLRNIANVFWGLYNIDNPADCEYQKALDSFQDVKYCFNTAPFALVECKKQGGETSISDKTLKTYLVRYRSFIHKELDLLSPNIIVCSNNLIFDFIIDYFKGKHTDSSPIALPEEKYNNLRIHPKTRTLILNSFHPSARISYETFYMRIMESYRAFLQSEYFNLYKNQLLIMATWKITVKDTNTYNGVHLEKGMFVEYITPTLDHPLYKTTHHDAFNQLFKTKYGIDLKKIGFINDARLTFEKK